MSWRSVLKFGGKAAKWAGRNTGRLLETGGKAILHPAQTLKTTGTAVKSAAVAGGIGYVGWKKLTTDESVVGIVSDAIIGEKATQKVSDTVSGAVDGIRDLKDSVSGMSERVSSAAGNVDSKLGGISSFLSDVSSGNGGQMLGGFLQNLTHGNVSGLGVMGLVLSSFLVFGRFGWMARIAGAVLAMMTIGSIQAGTARTEQAEKQMQLPEPPQEAEQIHRRR